MLRANTLVLGLLIGLSYMGFVRPYTSAINTLEAEQTQLQQDQQEVKQTFERQKQMVLDQDNIPKDILKRVPTTVQQEEVIRTLEQLAQRTGYTFNQLSFNQRYNKTLNAEQLDISFSVSGDTDTFLQFLRAIETNPRFMGMQTLSVQQSTTPEGKDMTSLGVSLYTYSQT